MIAQYWENEKHLMVCVWCVLSTKLRKNL